MTSVTENSVDYYEPESQSGTFAEWCKEHKYDPKTRTYERDDDES